MIRLYDFLFNKKSIKIILILTGIIFTASLWNRYIYIDDCWHGEEAYWLAREGVVKTKSMQGILGFEEKVMVYHKLNILLGALVIKTFGWSVYYLKLITLAFYLLFFVTLRNYISRFPTRHSQEHFLTAAFFVFVTPLMVHLGFTYRPEILAMFFGFLSFYSLEVFLEEKHTRWLVGSAIFSGLAFFTHLNAMIFGIAGFFLLLFNKKFRSSLLFAFITLVVSMLYTFDLWQADNYQVFRFQIENWPTLKLGKTYLSSDIGDFLVRKILNLLNEHQRFFWSDKVAAFSLMFFIATLSRLNYLLKNHRNLLIYNILLIISLNLTGSHIAERFMIYYYPFMALLVAIVVLSIRGHKGLMAVKTALVLVFAANLVMVGIRFTDIFRQNKDYPAIHRQLSAVINDPGTKVLAPDRFVFNEIESRPILSYHAWEYYEDIHSLKLTQHEALKLAKELGAKYIILDKDIQSDENPIFRNGIINPNPFYEIYKEWEEYLILRRKDR